MRASIGGSDTLRLHYNIVAFERQCWPKKKYLSEWGKSDIILTYSIRVSQHPGAIGPLDAFPLPKIIEYLCRYGYKAHEQRCPCAFLYINVLALAEGKNNFEGSCVGNEISYRKQEHPRHYTCAWPWQSGVS